MRFVVFNQKGGVGKTSVACNLAAAWANSGKKVLMVDLDSQGNSTQYCLGEAALGLEYTVSSFFESTLTFKMFDESLKRAVCATPHANLWVVPADQKLAELQPKLESKFKIFKLKQALDDLDKTLRFDITVIDTPPASNFYSLSALIAGNQVLVPFDCDAFSARAVDEVMDTIDEVKADHNPQLEVGGVVVNQYLSNAKLPKEAIGYLVSRKYPILKPYLSSSVAMRESHALSCPLVNCRPNHKLSKEIVELASRLLVDASGKNNKASKKSISASRDVF